MARILPPPPERFDPITARWVTPGGPLHDPQREGTGPDQGEPVTLVDPIPEELAQPSLEVRTGTGPAQRLRWAVLAVLALVVAAILIGGLLSA